MKTNRIILVIGLVSFLMIFLYLIVVKESSSGKSEDMSSEKIAVPAGEKQLNKFNERPGLTEYEKIEIGMTINQVKTILDTPSNRVKDDFSGTKSELIVYEANGKATSFIFIELIDREVDSKGHIDIKE